VHTPPTTHKSYNERMDERRADPLRRLPGNFFRSISG
jgi:hypothetical protein